MTKGKVKLTLLEVEQTLNSELFQKALKKAFPQKTAYWIGVLVDKMMQALKPIKDMREKIIETYANKNEDGTPQIKLDSSGNKTETIEFGENTSIVDREFKDFYETEIEFNKVPISMDRLDEREKEKRDDLPTPADFAVISKFLEPE